MTPGYVDLHLHLLPGVDDGAKDMEESVAMARALVAAGYSDAAPSPHAWPEFASAQEAADKRAALQERLSSEGIALRLHAGAENRLDPDLFARIDKGDARPIAGGRFLLVELPFQAPVPRLPDLLFRLQTKGATPLIAHPERCLEFVGNRARAKAAHDAGALFQIELASLLGGYGSAAELMAARLLDDDLVYVAATDLHHAEGALDWIPEAIQTLERRVGAPRVRELLADHPRRIIEGTAGEVT